MRLRSLGGLVGTAWMSATAVAAPPQVTLERDGPAVVARAAAPADGPIATPAVKADFAALAPSAGELGLGPAGSCDTGCQTCGPEGRVWGRLEYLYWVTSGQSLPALATTSPAGTPLGAAGVLGAAGTTVVSGGQRANNDFRSGFRLTAGAWLDPEQTCGLEGDFFFLGRSRERAAFGSADGSSIVSRPFTNAATGVADAELVSFPNILAGRVTVDPRTSVIGGGVNALSNLRCDPCGRIDFLLGYRYFNVDDEVRVGENLTALPGSNVPAGTSFVIQDRFRTRNDFHGGLLGVAGERRFGTLFLGYRASAALGANRQTTDIDGVTIITPPGGTGTTYSGGLLAQSTNSGRYTRSRFAVLPEANLRLGLQVTDTIRVYGGYNFLYLSNVARAGDQITTTVNPSLLPPSGGLVGPAAPVYSPKTTDFFIHGVSVGTEIRF